ncbi:DUF4147 domain-containing protein [Thermogymnomonas acidicola]|uniref:MOFRL family protein n=1 Tax=Thermogymnomonas acidicola TaxID=399579 RepID=UPI000946585C|nr:MOFRL family protein [Thermogymnomonas acidicola]
MSRVKAGGLAVMLYPARVHGLVVSDVMGDDLSVIASGPPLTMLRDTRRVEEALRKFRERCLPGGVMVQQVGERSDPRYFERVEQQIVLSNSDFVQSGIRYLASRRVDFVSFGSNLRGGEVSEFSRRLAQALRQAYSLRGGSPFWFVCGGGETTVQVRGGNGRGGGRAQELVLRFMEEMGDDEDFLLACFGTDGIDGRSDAAGGISDNWLRERVGRDEVERYLAGSDSGTLLMSRDSAIVTGRTGNNVSDIMVGYYAGGELFLIGNRRKGTLSDGYATVGGQRFSALFTSDPSPGDTLRLGGGDVFVAERPNPCDLPAVMARKAQIIQPWDAATWHSARGGEERLPRPGERRGLWRTLRSAPLNNRALGGEAR